MRKWILAVVLAGILLPAHAQLQRKYQYGVEPTDIGGLAALFG